MVTDLCQALGSGSSVCLCVFLSGRQDGDRFVSGDWVKQFCVFLLGRQDGDRFVSVAWVRQFCVFVCASIRETRW